MGIFDKRGCKLELLSALISDQELLLKTAFLFRSYASEKVVIDEFVLGSFERQRIQLSSKHSFLHAALLLFAGKAKEESAISFVRR
jgi:hypothetical protein